MLFLKHVFTLTDFTLGQTNLKYGMKWDFFFLTHSPIR